LFSRMRLARDQDTQQLVAHAVDRNHCAFLTSVISLSSGEAAIAIDVRPGVLDIYLDVDGLPALPVRSFDHSPPRRTTILARSPPHPPPPLTPLIVHPEVRSDLSDVRSGGRGIAMLRSRSSLRPRDQGLHRGLKSKPRRVGRNVCTRPSVSEMSPRRVDRRERPTASTQRAE